MEAIKATLRQGYMSLFLIQLMVNLIEIILQILIFYHNFLVLKIEAYHIQEAFLSLLLLLIQLKATHQAVEKVL